MDPMSILIWLIVGGLAGWIASMIMGKDAQMGLLANIVVGIIGAFIGGWMLGLFGVAVADGAFNPLSIVSAIIGACVLLFILSLVGGSRRRV